jgi:threonine dehydratase
MTSTSNLVDPRWLEPPSRPDIDDAASRIRNVLVETPLLENERVNERIGRRLLIKAEGLQRTGSFKARGAWNRLSLLDADEVGRGIVALSSGNHGHAVAWAAYRLGLKPVVILMPLGSPNAKVEHIKDWGAEVVFFDRYVADRAALMRHWTLERGFVAISAYDDRRIIAGAATLAREALQQTDGLGVTPDALLAGCAGGGLVAGCALALEGRTNDTSVWGVEPEDYDDTARSLAIGRRVANGKATGSVCDALLAPIPGELTFSINARLLAGVRAVADEFALKAMKMLFKNFGLVVEPGGALALGALLADPSYLREKTVVVVTSGSNVDEGLYATALGDASEKG